MVNVVGVWYDHSLIDHSLSEDSPANITIGTSVCHYQGSNSGNASSQANAPPTRVLDMASNFYATRYQDDRISFSR